MRVQSWSRLSEQNLRVDKWRGAMAEPANAIRTSPNITVATHGGNAVGATVLCGPPSR